MTLRELKWFVFDLTFPTATPLTAEQTNREEELARSERKECETRAKALPDDAAIVASYLAQSTSLLDAEDERRRGVESRLTSIIGLSSIAGTLVFGGILAQASGTLGSQNRFFRAMMAFGALYLALQICSAILAAIRGLERRGYTSAAPSDFLPDPQTTALVHLKTQVANQGTRLVDHRLQNNEKVSQMGVAHRAMKNFIYVLIVLACLGSYFAFTASATNNLVQALKTNHELNDMLRGPQGPKGDPGPMGPKGEATKKLKSKPCTCK